jgi:hypothetical protein
VSGEDSRRFRLTRQDHESGWLLMLILSGVLGVLGALAVASMLWVGMSILRPAGSYPQGHVLTSDIGAAY